MKKALSNFRMGWRTVFPNAYETSLWALAKALCSAESFARHLLLGRQLRIEVETLRLKPTVGHVQARCKVAGKLVAEAQFKFTLVDA